MRATVIYGERDVRLEEVPDPEIHEPGDAIVRVVAACICGSDLWPYRGIRPTPKPRRIGHEMVGVVEQVGDAVSRVSVGDFVIAPFYICDNTCVNCRNGMTTSCLNGLAWGGTDETGARIDGCQGEKVRVPFADGTLVAVPGEPDAAAIPSLLALSDVCGTGHHAAVSAGVGPGASVVVVGDGAVGLSAVLAAKRVGAERIIAMSRHEDRQALACDFGATDVIAERGEEGAERVRELTDGIGADAVLECVGTKESMDQALRSTRPGGRVGFVGVPAGGPELPMQTLFSTNIGVAGGMAPVRGYIEDLLPAVLAGDYSAGRVFDSELPLDRVAEGYAAMDERRAIKVLLRP
ncbi:hypothetical protein SAMN04489806_1747 [Paramicrobacterium humi]|uniref:Enoyl reductase (ER) domain-containing protein n=1 Tax=Paramicrobacterium humi TaxID=640635 RepID=A0A1H4M4A6_9MICO|nr:zinc-dependent alcohol dehydrogenase family protein [Microbacterium humi]SEB77637.1 hypothetical protein SAMN04489806_1747 [Microbacterium humi]